MFEILSQGHKFISDFYDNEEEWSCISIRLVDKADENTWEFVTEMDGIVQVWQARGRCGMYFEIKRVEPSGRT